MSNENPSREPDIPRTHADIPSSHSGTSSPRPDIPGLHDLESTEVSKQPGSFDLDIHTDVVVSESLPSASRSDVDTVGVVKHDGAVGEVSTDAVVGVVTTVDEVGVVTHDEARSDVLAVDAVGLAPPDDVDESESLCAICLSTIALLSVRTSCRHAYCCACLMTYWRHQAQLGRMKCPTCRAAVSTLSLVVGEEAEATGEAQAQREHVQAVECYNMRFSSSPKPVGQHARNLILLLGCCLCEFFSERGLIWMFWLRLVIVFMSLCVGVLSLLDIGTIPRDAIVELDVMVDRVYLCLLFVVYCSILIRRNLGHHHGYEVM